MTAERLQPMPNDESLRDCISELEARHDVVTKLRHHARRRRMFRPMIRLADMTDVEVLARAQERLEEQISIIVTQRPIATRRFHGDQVERLPWCLTRELALVHAEQRDDPRGNSAHGLQGAEGHPAVEESAGRRSLS